MQQTIVLKKNKKNKNFFYSKIMEQSSEKTNLKNTHEKAVVKEAL